MRRLDEFSLLGWDSVQPVVDRNIADAVAFCSQNPVADLQLVHSLLLARDRLNQSVGSKAEERAEATTAAGTTSAGSARGLSGSTRGTACLRGWLIGRSLSVGVHWGNCIAAGGDVLHELAGWLGITSSREWCSVLWNGCALKIRQRNVDIW